MPRKGKKWNKKQRASYNKTMLYRKLNKGNQIKSKHYNKVVADDVISTGYNNTDLLGNLKKVNFDDLGIPMENEEVKQLKIRVEKLEKELQQERFFQQGYSAALKDIISELR